jgi:aminobenzoyl-glutamate transport protein
MDNQNNSFTARMLGAVERVGNLLPHPGALFAYFALGIILLSGLISLFGVAAIHPGTGETIEVYNLMTRRGLHMIMTGMVTNFTSFAPLGTVLVALLGIGIAEASGLMSTGLRLLVISAPKKFLTFAIVFAGILSNTASEVGYVVLVPLGGMIFLAVGRNPIAGIAAAFAGVSGGYSANLLLGTIDPLLAGLSEEAARIVDPAYTVNPAANYYFMFVSTFFIAAIGTWVTEKIIVPRLGAYKGDAKPEEIKKLDANEKRGLKFYPCCIYYYCNSPCLEHGSHRQGYLGFYSRKWLFAGPRYRWSFTVSIHARYCSHYFSYCRYPGDCVWHWRKNPQKQR